VEVLADQCPEDGHEDGSSAEDHGLNGRRVLGGEAEGAEYWWWILWMYL